MENYIILNKKYICSECQGSPSPAHMTADDFIKVTLWGAKVDKPHNIYILNKHIFLNIFFNP